jgi:Na+/phosphate symporter
LASNTKKREGKTTSSLGLFFNLIIIIVFIIIFTIVVGIVVPSLRVFYHGRRKWRIDDRLRDLKAHRSAYFALALLQMRKPLAHLLVRLVDKSVVGAAHGDEGLKALDKNVMLLAPTSGSSRRLRRS